MQEHGSLPTEGIAEGDVGLWDAEHPALLPAGGADGAACPWGALMSWPFVQHRPVAPRHACFQTLGADLPCRGSQGSRSPRDTQQSILTNPQERAGRNLAVVNSVGRMS